MERRRFLINSGALSLVFSPISSMAQELTLVGGEEIILEPLFDKKRIYLTIDDCPNKNMTTILENLKENKATFYVVGMQTMTSNGFEAICKALNQGHILGNHSYSHPSFSRISLSRAKYEIEKADEVIEVAHQATGVPRTNKLFRFPYGDPGYYKSDTETYGTPEKKYELKEFLKGLGYQVQFWNTDTEDWKHYSPKYNYSLERIMRNCAKAKDEDIVLCHDKLITAKYIVPFYVNSREYQLTLPSVNLTNEHSLI